MGFEEDIAQKFLCHAVLDQRNINPEMSLEYRQLYNSKLNAIDNETIKNKEFKKYLDYRYKYLNMQFIGTYLNPASSWDDSSRLNYNIVLNAFHVFAKDYVFCLDNGFNTSLDDKICEAILDMPYELFLLTPYWRAISTGVKYLSYGKCSMCGSQLKLNVHHKTYEHHGLEHRYYKYDLICVCEKCHKKLHNIK